MGYNVSIQGIQQVRFRKRARKYMEVFKTDVQTQQEALALKKILYEVLLNSHIHFDLEDCDRVLRIQQIHAPIPSSIVIQLLMRQGYNASLLS